MAIDFAGGLGPAPPENNVLQSFGDATAGRSLQLYWGCATTDSGGADYVLARDAGTSIPARTEAPSAVAVVLDFDITINKPTIFAGIATIDFRYGAAGAGSDSSPVIVFTFYHYDGSTETSLGTVTSATHPGTSENYVEHKVQLTVTRKIFGIGHVLRLKASIQGGFGAASKAVLYHDPLTAGSELKLWAPVVNLE